MTISIGRPLLDRMCTNVAIESRPLVSVAIGDLMLYEEDGENLKRHKIAELHHRLIDKAIANHEKKKRRRFFPKFVR